MEITIKLTVYSKSVGTSSRVWRLSYQLPCINRAHLCGLYTTQKFDIVHYYLYLATDSPSYKYKHCCLCSLLLVTKCYDTGGPRLPMYCTDAIKTPPNIESITTVLFHYCISKLVQPPLLTPCK